MANHSDELRLAHLSYISECRKSFAQMGTTDARVRLAYCLYCDSRPWTISGLANATEMSRSTIRQAVANTANQGFVDYTQGSVQVTDAGKNRIRERIDEFFQLVQPPLFRFHRILAEEYPKLGGKG